MCSRISYSTAVVVVSPSTIRRGERFSVSPGSRFPSSSQGAVSDVGPLESTFVITKRVFFIVNLSSDVAVPKPGQYIPHDRAQTQKSCTPYIDCLSTGDPIFCGSASAYPSRAFLTLTPRPINHFSLTSSSSSGPAPCPFLRPALPAIKPSTFYSGATPIQFAGTGRN